MNKRRICAQSLSLLLFLLCGIGNAQDGGQGIIEKIVQQSQPKMVKVYGAGAGAWKVSPPGFSFRLRVIF